VTLPEDKGTRFAADSPENALHEKISEKFCGGSSGGEFRLKIGYMGHQGYINLMLRVM
jgi:hypothetical protein